MFHFSGARKTVNLTDPGLSLESTASETEAGLSIALETNAGHSKASKTNSGSAIIKKKVKSN